VTERCDEEIKQSNKTEIGKAPILIEFDACTDALGGEPRYPRKIRLQVPEN